MGGGGTGQVYLERVAELQGYARGREAQQHAGTHHDAHALVPQDVARDAAGGVCVEGGHEAGPGLFCHFDA